MRPSTRGTVVHAKFSECVEAISAGEPIAKRIIDGAVWEIERNPTGSGVYIEKYDVWQARVILPSGQELLLMYAVDRGIVKMLTIIVADE
jgi:hypothetical protein